MELETREKQPSPRIFHGWYIVATVILTGTFLGGFQSYAFSFFFILLSFHKNSSRSAHGPISPIRPSQPQEFSASVKELLIVVVVLNVLAHFMG